MTNIFLSFTSCLSLTFVGQHGHFLSEESHSSGGGGGEGVELALNLRFWDEMMITIVVYAVTEVSIKTSVLASTQMLATQNRGPLSKPVILCIEEEALSLSVFTIVFVLFLLLSYF